MAKHIADRRSQRDNIQTFIERLPGALNGSAASSDARVIAARAADASHTGAQTVDALNQIARRAPSVTTTSRYRLSGLLIGWAVAMVVGTSSSTRQRARQPAHKPLSHIAPPSRSSVLLPRRPAAASSATHHDLRSRRMCPETRRR